ncbi:MAG: hypothetical protein K2J82_10650, partial [Muribaculaceae bacterium]|nr:hypothetical protein [Muribaculaceae bacterium]
MIVNDFRMKKDNFIKNREQRDEATNSEEQNTWSDWKSGRNDRNGFSAVVDADGSLQCLDIG